MPNLLNSKPDEVRLNGLHPIGNIQPPVGLWAKLVLVLLLVEPLAASAANSQAVATNPDQATEVVSTQGFESPATSSPDNAADPLQTVEATAVKPVDECDWQLKGRPWQEQTQSVVYGISCHSFRWFDHLFGDQKDFPEEEVNGLWLLGLEYREYDGFDFRGRFRVRAPLPNLSNRWDLIIGRENEEEFVSDTAPTEQILYNPGLSRAQDNEWLLGLGHRRDDRRKGLDYSVGVRLGTPPNLYGKVQYYYNKQYSEKTDLQFRQTLFWRTDEGLGTTSRANLVHKASDKNVMRWEGLATISEDTGGMNWYAAQTWYHQLHGKNALSLQAFASGETDEEVPLRDYGLNLIWRQPFTRDWMFLSMGPNITWPRRFKSEQRELSLGFSLWIEMEFGDYRY